MELNPTSRTLKDFFPKQEIVTLIAWFISPVAEGTLCLITLALYYSFFFFFSPSNSIYPQPLRRRLSFDYLPSEARKRNDSKRIRHDSWLSSRSYNYVLASLSQRIRRLHLFHFPPSCPWDCFQLKKRKKERKGIACIMGWVVRSKNKTEPKLLLFSFSSCFLLHFNPWLCWVLLPDATPGKKLCRFIHMPCLRLRSLLSKVHSHWPRLSLVIQLRCVFENTHRISSVRLSY